jgi:ABC-2 type transport system ATP-binding protein
VAVELKAIEVDRLVKVYPGGVRALDGVSLAVEEGSSHALLGPNGAGKTTLIRILTTQLRPTSGTARVMGFDVISQASRVRELVGYVPQEMSLWTDLTGYENMLVYAKICGIPSSRRREVIEELLDFMELREAAHRLVRTYSGGMIRRLEIAIALMSRPRILILDEPTIGLDPRARSLVWDRLLSYKRESGTTIFFATHYMDEAERYAGAVTILDRGRVIAEGSPEYLKETVGSDGVAVRIGLAEGFERVGEAVKVLSDMGFRVVGDGGSIVAYVGRVSKDLPRLLEALYGAGLRVREVEVRERTLDDVFITLTGRSIEESHGTLKEVLATRRMIRRGG